MAVVFGQTVQHEFINFDDNVYVYDNPQVAHGLTAEAVAWSFTAFHASNWHPLTWLSHALDCQLYGTQHPGLHHLTNVLLHAAVAILLFLVLWQMTGSLWPSAFVAAVFAVHPLRAESVAWVAERKDLLSGLFFMLTLGGLSPLRPPSVFLGPLSPGDSGVRPGLDGQTDAGDAAVRAAAAGLLAVAGECRAVVMPLAVSQTVPVGGKAAIDRREAPPACCWRPFPAGSRRWPSTVRSFPSTWCRSTRGSPTP